jgi:hypothetical protein
MFCGIVEIAKERLNETFYLLKGGIAILYGSSIFRIGNAEVRRRGRAFSWQGV